MSQRASQRWCRRPPPSRLVRQRKGCPAQKAAQINECGGAAGEGFALGSRGQVASSATRMQFVDSRSSIFRRMKCESPVLLQSICSLRASCLLAARPLHLAAASRIKVAEGEPLTQPFFWI